MPEKRAGHPISGDDLGKHLSKVNEHMESISRGGMETPSLFKLVKDIGGDEHIMAPEVENTIRALRDGFSLYYEMHAILEDQVAEIDGGVTKSEKDSFMGAYSMFAASSFIANRLNLQLEGGEEIPVPRKDGYFKFDVGKDNTLNYVLSRFYGLVNIGKRNNVIKEGADLPRGSVDFFRFLREQALARRETFHADLVDLVDDAEFNVEGDFRISGFESTYEQQHEGGEKVEFVPVEPHEVAGNVLAKKEMLRDMDRIVLYDPQDKKNPILDVGGLSWSVLYDGLPGTGKSSLFRMGLTRLLNRLEQVNEFWKSKNIKPLHGKQLVIDQSVKNEYYGKTAERLLSILNEAKRDDGIYIPTIDDIDLLVSGDRDSSSGGADRDILNVLMQFSDGINTVVRGNSQMWAATNDATAMDPALRQRFISRYSVDGPQEWYDFADIFHAKLGTWLEHGIVNVSTGNGYEPFEMRKGQTGHESSKGSGVISKIGKAFSSDVTMRDIGEFAKKEKDKNPRFTGRAIHAVTEAIKKRVNDYEIPEDWYENPDTFFFRDYDARIGMLRELCRPIDGNVILEEMSRYAESEGRYADDKFHSDVEKGVHNLRVREEVLKQHGEKKSLRKI